jgi:nicotinate-nucleotide adenylyltransferase
MKRIGVYGGTFDPIHNAHLKIARLVSDGFRLERMLLVPAHVPPHKEADSVTSAYHRFAMAALATIDEPALGVSTVEVEAPHRPYTFETIERLRADAGEDAVLFFVMGTDSFEELGTWRNPERLLMASNLVVITRPGHPVSTAALNRGIFAGIRDWRGRKREEFDSADQQASGLVYLTDVVCDDLSSTDLRRRVRAGESIDDMVPPRVAAYIRKYDLYGRLN